MIRLDGSFIIKMVLSKALVRTLLVGVPESPRGSCKRRR